MKRILLIATLSLVLAAGFAAAQQAVVKVSGKVTVQAPSLTLGDIASVESDDAAIAQRLRGIRLGVSPMPGNWREIDRLMISTQINRTGYTEQNVKLVCPSLVTIYRESQTVSGQSLELQLRDYILANSPWDPAEMEITGINRIGDQVIPAGALEVNIQPRGEGDFLGQTPFAVNLLVDGNTVRQMVMQARISVYRYAVVAASAVPARSIVDNNAVELRRVDISKARGTSFTNIDDVAGLATTTYLQAGQIIATHHVTQPTIVKRGQAISLEATRPGFSVRTAGVAQQDGKKGQVIRVLNPASRKVVEALVVAPDRAEVIF